MDESNITPPNSSSAVTVSTSVALNDDKYTREDLHKILLKAEIEKVREEREKIREETVLIKLQQSKIQLQINQLKGTSSGNPTAVVSHADASYNDNYQTVQDDYGRTFTCMQPL